MIRKKIKVIVRGKSKFKSMLLNSLINNSTDRKEKYHSTQNKHFFFSFSYKDDSIYSVELYDNITSSEHNILCVLYVFDYMNDESFIECADKGSKEHFENIFRAKNSVDIIPKIVFICCDYPFYSDEDDDKVNFYIRSLVKKKISDNEQAAKTQIIFTNIKNEFVFREKIKNLFANASEEKPKIVTEIRTTESEEEYEESESNSSSETAHESNHIKRHKNKTLLDKLLSLVTNCCGTREKHIEDDNFNTVNVSSCDSDTK